ncbi:hypothetical protein BDV93DRAFT_512607 [Ceratobasidium sp. AG-I]|nr:hypothetical protein BDV93DRAFT_512607 [Ceratobasidium sp. AG-I]
MKLSLPKLEFALSRPYPRNHLFFIATSVIFLLVIPILVIVNILTLGYELVPSLRPQFQPNNTLASWWDSTRLPALLRGHTPICEPRDLGRGDAFRLSASLFDYTVMSTWNTTKAAASSSQIQEQERVEYRGESFASCRASTAKFDYSMLDDTQTMTIGVICPGNLAYPVYVSMQTKMVFSRLLGDDLIGQYYGPGLDLLNIEYAYPNDYRKLAFGVLDVIATDSISILGGQHLSSFVLSLTVVANTTFIDGKIKTMPVSNSIRYLNGTLDSWPTEANIYAKSIYNLMNVAVHTVNLDLGSAGSESIYQNSSALNMTIGSNLAPAGIMPADWAQRNTKTFYYGLISPPYQTWAQMLRAGLPFKLGTVTGLPNGSSIVTTYLCPNYQIKPIRSFLTSIFVGTATMFISCWTVWTFVMTWIACGIEEPCLVLSVVL